ncbi:flavin reductase [Planctomycetota bacterium]|nr:flavin reductase [Planctomycetota bacterium]
MPSNISDQSTSTPTDSPISDIASILGKIPAGVYVLTAYHETRRLGMLTSWVQQVCFQPPMISVAIAKGRPIMPLISESRRFALCQLSPDDKLIRRKFSAPGDLSDDPFLGYDVIHGNSPSIPILAAALNFMECEVACHMDVDGDHDIFIAKVTNAKILNTGSPEIHLRDDGFKY